MAISCKGNFDRLYKLISTHLCRVVLRMMARNSEKPTVPPPSLQKCFSVFFHSAKIKPVNICKQKLEDIISVSSLPVKELKGGPVEGVRFAEVRLKGDKLVEGDELGAILALVQDSTKECKSLFVVIFLREQSQESNHEVLIGEKLFPTLG